MKKNPALIVGIALPIVFILVLVAVILIPSLSIKPKYDFLYSLSNYNSYNELYKNNYQVDGGKLSLQPVTVESNPGPGTVIQDAPQIFMYDVKTNTTHQVTFADAQKLTLDPGPASSDGYTVNYQYGNGGVLDLFGGDDNTYGYYVSKGNAAKRLTGLPSNSYGYNNGGFVFIGWIEQ
jgi:hypothetical protein